MTQIAYFTQGTTFTSYSPQAIGYATNPDQLKFIVNATKNLGLPISYAIAGAMAEENASYLQSSAVNILSDQYAQRNLDVQTAAQFALNLATKGPAYALANLTLSALQMRTHAEWVALYAAKPQTDIGVTEIDKLLNPVLMDVGQGNIKIATAIRLLQESSQADVSALGLDGYKTDYAALVNDLINDDPTKGVTAKLYGLMIKEADKWYTDHNAYGADWATLPQEIKDALYVTYTNLGRDWMNNSSSVRLKIEQI